MLTHLHIRHFAIIDSCELELSEGMTALTGETGAGKSILLDALGLVLGGRASTDSIQQGQKRADITATFTIDHLPQVISWLEQHELDAENECILRRSLNSSGKSRASINDIPVSVQTLRDIGRHLVTIHGQNAHQDLGKSNEQRVMLDAVAGTSQLEKVETAFRLWQLADEKLRRHEQDSRMREQRIDLLSFQLQEFDALELGSESIESIESEHQWLANSERIMMLGHEVLECLNDQASPALNRSLKPLGDLANIDQRLQEALDLVESAAIQSSESAQAVQHAMNALTHDDARLNWLDQKLSALHALAKKHQCELNELSCVENTLREEYQLLLAPANSLEELQREYDALLETWNLEAAKLTRHRKKHAKALGKQISNSMQSLSMKGGVFRIDINAAKKGPQAQGNDVVSFMVSPNPGMDPAPLARIASGGELSRISLCIQIAMLKTRSVPTLIFDEVDAGVGGAVAETVGQLLRQLGTRAQVLCVTHLPQVAAQANNHLKVGKTVTDGRTLTSVACLDGKSIRDEIARMLGGAKLTKKSQQHAQEMLDEAASSA